jgi:hypothetical protein
MSNQNLKCPFCPKTSSRGTGLASHVRFVHPAQYSDWSRSRKGIQKATASSPSSKPTGAAGGFQNVIDRLEQQKSAIEQALIALRQVNDLATPNVADPPAKKRGRPRNVG